MPRRQDESTGSSEGPRDRRTAGSRLLVELPVTVISDGFQHACRSVDISLSGMVVQLNRSLAAREPHLVYSYDLELEGGRRIRFVGRTAWRQGSLQGVRFIDLSEDDRQAMSDFMHEIRRRRASDLDRLALAEHLDRLHAIGHGKSAA